MRKPDFSICKNKDADQFHREREADHAFVFAIRIVQSLFFLNPKFPASSHLLWLYSLICVGPGLKPLGKVFSCCGSYVLGSLLCRCYSGLNNQTISFLCISFF